MEYSNDIITDSSIKRKDITEDYIFKDYISEGSYGKVYKGMNKETFEIVAIKCISKERMLKNILGDDYKEKYDKIRKDIERESTILKLFSHPNIVKYIDCYEDVEKNGNFYIIMEYIRGRELLDYVLKYQEIGRNGFSEETAKVIFSQILSAVEHFHSYLIAHRDIKLENILVDVNDKGAINKIVIVDFGLANFVKIDELHHTMAGSPNYTPPEIIMHQKYKPLLVDIWNLGVSLFCMITGYFPFSNKDTVKALEQIKTCSINYSSLGLSYKLQDLFNKIFQHPEKRISLEGIKNHPWMEGYVSECYLPKVSLPINEIDFIIVEKMITLGFDGNEIFNNVFNKKNTAITHIYETLYLKYGKKASKKKSANVIRKSKSDPDGHKSITFKGCSDDEDDEIETEVHNYPKYNKNNNNNINITKRRDRRRPSLDNFLTLNIKKIFYKSTDDDTDSEDSLSPKDLSIDDLFSPRDTTSPRDDIVGTKSPNGKRKSPRKISPRLMKNIGKKNVDKKKDVRNIFISE